MSVAATGRRVRHLTVNYFYEDIMTSHGINSLNAKDSEDSPEELFIGAAESLIEAANSYTRAGKALVG